MERYDDVVTLGEIVSVTKATDVDWHHHDPDEGIGAEMLAYNDVGLTVCGVVRIVCENPRLAFARALSLYEEPALVFKSSWTHGTVSMCVNTVLQGIAPSTINDGFDTLPIIGHGCVIGGAGFGYVRDENGELVRIKHLGRVVLGEKVVIHSNVCIDRGVIGDTVIGEGTKIDNLTHIAHNCKIGKNNSFAASCDIEGSVVIGDSNTFGTNVTVLRKVKIGSGCLIGSGAVVTKDVPNGEVWAGNPARKLR